MSNNWKLEIFILSGDKGEWLVAGTFPYKDEAETEGERYLGFPNHIKYKVSPIV